MKKYLSVLIGLFISISSMADLTTFQKNWIYSKSKTQQFRDGKVTIKQFTRLTKFQNNVWPISQTTYLFNTNKTNESPLDIFKTITKNFPNQKWESKIKDGNVSGTSYWKGLNRIHAIFIGKYDNGFLITSSLIRVGYKDIVFNELKSLHRALNSYHSSNKFSFIPSIINKVYANSFLDLEQILGNENNPIVGDTQMGIAPGGVIQVGGTIDHNHTLNIDQTQFETLSSDLKNATNTLNTSNAEIAKVNQTVNNLNTTLNESANTLNSSVEQVTDSVNDMGKVLEKFTDAGHMAKVGFATGAGTALGAILVNTGIDLLASGIDVIKEWITGEKEDIENWENFNKARKNWESLRKQSSVIEKTVDNFLTQINMLDLLPESNEQMDVFQSLEKYLYIKEFEAEQFKRNSENEKLSLNCREAQYIRFKKLDTWIKNVEKLVEHNKAQGLGQYQHNDLFICTQIQHFLKKLADVEMQMQNYRYYFLRAQDQYYEKLAEDFEVISEKVAEINDEDYEEDVINAYNDSLETMMDSKKEEFITDCRKDPKKYKIPSREFDSSTNKNKWILSRCNSRYSEIYSDIHKKEVATRTGAKQQAQANEQNKNITLKSPDLTYLRVLQSNKMWFDRIRVEQECAEIIMSAAKSQAAIDCQKGNASLFSMEDSFKKLRNKYQDKSCDLLIQDLSNKITKADEERGPKFDTSEDFLFY